VLRKCFAVVSERENDDEEEKKIRGRNAEHRRGLQLSFVFFRESIWFFRVRLGLYPSQLRTQIMHCVLNTDHRLLFCRIVVHITHQPGLDHGGRCWGAPRPGGVVTPPGPPRPPSVRGSCRCQPPGAGVLPQPPLALLPVVRVPSRPPAHASPLLLPQPGAPPVLPHPPAGPEALAGRAHASVGAVGAELLPLALAEPEPQPRLPL
jgi:hypothetical protein